ncbi:MAG TPA: hypothetical protein VEY07_01555 [Thermoplasmata archaeon]|nr:hypothetical protein [Thermoplasmata archaeon]
MPLSKSEIAAHRRTMARCFNEAWAYLDRKRRNVEEERRMLDLAHTARHMARIAGTWRNQAIGDWQVSRVYAAMGEARLALKYARSSVGICRTRQLSDLLGTAWEAVARAQAVGGHTGQAGKSLDRARRILDRLSLAADDRDVFAEQIADTARLIRGRR